MAESHDKTETGRYSKRKTLPLRLLGRCLFCLRKTDNPSAPNRNRNAVPKAALRPDFLRTFNTVFTKLRNYSRGGNGKDNVFEWSSGLAGGQGRGRPVGTLPTVEFSRVPTMCQSCVDIVQQIESMMTAVSDQLKQIQKIIEEARKDVQTYRQGKHLFQNFQPPTIEEKEVVLSTMNFFDSIGYYVGLHSEDSTPIVVHESANINISEMSTSDHGNTSAHLDIERYNQIALDVSPATQNPSSVTRSSSYDSVDDNPDSTSIMPASKRRKIGISPDAGVWNDGESSSCSDDSASSSDPDYVKSEEFDSDSDDGEDDSDNEEHDESEPETKTSDNLQGSSDRARTAKPSSSRKAQQCRDCTEIFFNQQSRRLHHRSAHQELYNIKCDEPGCEKLFYSEYGFSIHRAATHCKGELLFPCSCGRSFSSKERQTYHFANSRIHAADRKTKPKPGTCSFCADRVPGENFLEHVQGHVGDYFLLCPKAPACPYVAPHRVSLIRHFRRNKTCLEVAKQKNFFHLVCETCGFQTDNSSLFKIHLVKDHERSPNKIFPCPVTGCKEIFCVRQSVEFHLCVHVDFRKRIIQKCEHCLRDFPVKAMTEHLKSQHDAQELVSCRKCPCVFSNSASFVAHMFAHRRGGLKCYICEDSRVSYKNHTRLWEHCSSVHQIEPPQLPCASCGTVFKKYKLLEKKCLKCRTAKLLKYKKRWFCEICFDRPSYATKYSLTSHNIKFHGEEPFFCPSCPEKFNTKAALQQHKKEHDGTQISEQREFKCEVEGCNKVLTSEKGLKQHIKTNHERKTHVCDQCGKAFHSPAALKNHEITHGELRLYICDTCGEGFKTASVLRKHNMIHTGERPFSCHICGQKFRYKEVLQTHIHGHETKGDAFKPNGPMKKVRKRLK